MNKNNLRAAVAIILLLVIISLFGYYIKQHPSILQALKNIKPWLLVLLLACYCLMMLWWMAVYNATLRLCGKPLNKKENLLLSIYSTLANFFLPLQSGPGVRAAYLKKRHHIPVSNYLLASLFYFAIYAVISAALLFVASNYWWLAVPAVIAAALVSYAVISLAKKRFEKKNPNLSLNLTTNNMIRLFLLTLGQLSTQALIYGIELNSLQLHDTLRRIISYTGAANFSLFVSLTPGAIGFREAFLEFSQRLHHFSTNAIIAANLIDRGVFIVFLGILFLIMVLTHAKDRLRL